MDLYASAIHWIIIFDMILKKCLENVVRVISLIENLNIASKLK